MAGSETVDFATELPFSSRSVTLARRLLRDHLRSVDAGDLITEDALLVLHELLSNCIDHGYPCPNETLHLSWRATGTQVDLTVTDHGPHPRCGRCHPARFGEPLAEPGRTRDPITAKNPPLEVARGRGLMIVEGLSDAWEVTTTEATTTVTARITATWRDRSAQPAPADPESSVLSE